MNQLYVRVQPKQGAERFFRCGIEFRQAWQTVEVDDATAARLAAEQMLEVSETKPAELENKAPNEADPSGHSTAATDSGTPAAAPTGAATTEQVLEVSETKPAELENKGPNEADPSGHSTTATDSGTPAAAPTGAANTDAGNQPPEDPALRLDVIRAAVGQLDKEDAALWTASGKAKTEAIAAITGWPVMAAERDAALVEGGEQ